MNDSLSWPFFDDGHRALARDLNAWAEDHLREEEAEGGAEDVEQVCRTLVARLGEAGWLRYCVAKEYGGANLAIDVRSLCLMRENLAKRSGLADFAFAMQGLGSGAISIGGTAEQKHKYLPQVAAGKLIAAFALSEPDAGSRPCHHRCFSV